MVLKDSKRKLSNNDFNCPSSDSKSWKKPSKNQKNCSMDRTVENPNLSLDLLHVHKSSFENSGKFEIYSRLHVCKYHSSKTLSSMNFSFMSFKRLVIIWFLFTHIRCMSYDHFDHKLFTHVIQTANYFIYLFQFEEFSFNKLEDRIHKFDSNWRKTF